MNAPVQHRLHEASAGEPTAVVHSRAQLFAPRPKGLAVGPIAIDFGTSSSTVTMDDINTDRRAVWPGQAAVLARGLASLLRRDDWPGVQGARIIHPDPLVLARRLDGDASREEQLADDRHLNDDSRDADDRERRLFTAVLAFEDALADPTLRPWLALPLHGVYQAAFAAPAPEAYRLTAVCLDLDEAKRSGRSDPGERDIPSTLVLKGTDITAARLRGSTGGATAEWVGIKRYLSAPRLVDDLNRLSLPANWAADSELLLALSYCDLVTRTHEYLDDLAERRDLPYYGGRHVEEVTLTYPTVTPPAARAALKQLVGDALGFMPQQIDTSYDEAIAAALYFVQRELGGDGRGGVDALRARSRRVPGTVPSWRRTMLVVDIGGGTTDIALLALELTEHPTDPGPFTGRHYTLAPTVRGTTGHNQLGGDLLTLRVFYWIKAVIADALADAAVPGVPALSDLWPVDSADRAVPARLVPLVVGFGSHEGAAPSAVREVLRDLVPTHDDGAGTNRLPEAFRKIWEMAEQAKKALADGRDVTLPGAFLVDLRNELTCSWAEAIGSLGERVGQRPADFTLRATDFAVLARPVYAHAMTLAARLARRVLGGTDDPVLDVVALAGRSCGGGRAGRPLAERVAVEVVSDVLAADGSGEGLVRWNPSSIVVEQRNAKQAASIGASWAYSRKGLLNAAAVPLEELATGDDLIGFTVADLVVELPCSFSVRGVDLMTIPLFEAGERLDEMRGDGTRFRSSRWMTMPPTLELLRRVDGGRDIRWGRFRYGQFADPPPDVRYRVEMDQQLRPRLLLRRGAEDHRVVSPACRHFELGPLLRPFEGPDGVVRMPRVEATLVDAGPEREPVVLFDERTDLDRWLHLDEDLGVTGRGTVPGSTQPVRGATSSATLPKPGPDAPPSDTLYYDIAVVAPTGERLDVGRIEVPGFALSLAQRYWVALDVRGRLWILREEPSLLRANDIREMEHVYGTTYVTDMSDFVSDWDPLRDPYCGVH